MFIQRELLTEIFAPIIWACVEQYTGIDNNLKLSINKKTIKQKLKTTINETLRYWEEEQLKMISQAAKALADIYNISHVTDHAITEIKYPLRHIFGGTTGKPNIMFDHTTPVTETVEKLILSKSIGEVETILNSTSEICLITQSENDELRIRRYQSKRPGGWEKCYAICGIKIYHKN